MQKHFLKSIFLSCFFSIIALKINAQSDTIGIIDFYGANKLDINALRNKVKIKEGDATTLIEKDNIVNNLKTLPGVKQAHLTVVCCEDKGRSLLFIGVSDKTLPEPYHTSPTADINLPEEISKDYDKFNTLMNEGILKGESGEDRSQGHSLMNYAPAEAIQLKFIEHTEKHLPVLKNVLRNSSNKEQRAIAAQIIAYAKDKNSVVDDLLFAVYDNDDAVRNNATRALAIIASYSANNPSLKIKKIPVEPFIEMMNSIVWTDRNKGSAVLFSLTEKTDSIVIDKIKKRALLPIIDMAKWKNPGHAMMGYFLLGRITGFSDEEIYKSFESDRNSFLAKMLIKAQPY